MIFKKSKWWCWLLGYVIPTVYIIRIFNPKKINPLYNRKCYWITNPMNTRTGIANPSDDVEIFISNKHIRAGEDSSKRKKTTKK
jgi:hypothetical protein